MTPGTPKTVFKARVAAWADRLDVELRNITVRPMRTKWASCSSEGNLTFDEALLGFDEAVQSYVIVHELAHLDVPCHDAAFWRIVNRYPKAERARGFLMARGLDGDD